MKAETEEKLNKIIKALGLGSREEAIAQAISDLSDEAKLEFFTYVYPFEDDSLSMMRSIAERYNLEWLKSLLQTKLRLRTSLNGWRADQIVEISRETMKQKQLGWFARNILRKKENKKGVEEFE
jgi:hypothetical protein